LEKSSLKYGKMKKNIKCNCKYCKTNSFTWKVNDNDLWIEIPKNGTTALKSTIYSKRSIVKSEEVKKYTHGILILRNPIDRFKSLLSHYFLKRRRWNRVLNIESWAKRYIGAKKRKDISGTNISKLVIDNWHNIEEIPVPHHWRTQSSFIPNDFLKLNLSVYDVSELNKEFNVKSYPKHKRNASESSEIILDDYCLEFINEFYKDDFEIYNLFLKK